MARKTTDNLMKELLTNKNLPAQEDTIPEFYQHLSNIYDKYHVTSYAVSLTIGMSSSQVAKYTSPRYKLVPGRNCLLLILAAIGASLDDVQTTLKYALHKELYPRNPRDCILIRCFQQGMKLTDIDLCLAQAGQPTLLTPED